jgi:hypothetical protein
MSTLETIVVDLLHTQDSDADEEEYNRHNLMMLNLLGVYRNIWKKSGEI